MKIIFSDIYETEVRVSISNSGYIRMDFEGEGFPKRKHKTTGDDLPSCISMTYPQANILLNAIKGLLEKVEE